MHVKLEEIAFGRGAYLVFLASVVIALAFADLPLSIFLSFLAAIIAIGAVAEALSRFLSKRLSALSMPDTVPAYPHRPGGPDTSPLTSKTLLALSMPDTFAA